MIHFFRKRNKVRDSIISGVSSRACSGVGSGNPGPKEHYWTFWIEIPSILHLKVGFHREKGIYPCLFCHRVIGKNKGYKIDDPIDQLVGTSWEEYIGGWTHWSCKKSNQARRILKEELEKKDFNICDEH